MRGEDVRHGSAAECDGDRLELQVNEHVKKGTALSTPQLGLSVAHHDGAINRSLMRIHRLRGCFGQSTTVLVQ
jgi:hypothetical protein